MEFWKEKESGNKKRAKSNNFENNDRMTRTKMCVRCKIQMKEEIFINWVMRNEPVWNDDLCGRLSRESKEHHSYNPSNTYCIHSCENQHVAYIEQRSALWAEVSTMAAICCPHHQDLQHPIQNQPKHKFESDPETETIKTIESKTKAIALSPKSNKKQSTNTSYTQKKSIQETQWEQSQWNLNGEQQKTNPD